MGRKRLSQRQVAKHLGLSQGAVHKRLAGLTPFRLAELDDLARLFDVPVVSLLGRTAAGSGPTHPTPTHPPTPSVPGPSRAA